MASVRETWTDERLDDLNHRVEELGRRVDDGFRELRGDLNAGFTALNTRIDAIQRTTIQFAGAMIAALIGLFAAQIGLIVTQL